MPDLTKEQLQDILGGCDNLKPGDLWSFDPDTVRSMATLALRGLELGECRYCANTGWFYGDSELGYCGCAFGKMREELTSTTGQTQ